MNSARMNSQMGNILIAEPAPASLRSQLAIANYNRILAQAPLKDEERAELLFQRGMLYDSVGLAGLAQLDFNRARNLKPDMAEVYNSLGIHYTQQQEFMQAYEAFDSTLDINPEFEFALLNRGIALYYGGRPDLASDDLSRFYNMNTEDPYRALWTFIADSEVDRQSAMQILEQHRQNLSDSNWASMIVDLYLERITESDLLNNFMQGVQTPQELNDRLCEVYFYLGKYHSARGNKGVASTYFKLALSTNVYEYVEHRYARLELSLLRRQTGKDFQAQ